MEGLSIRLRLTLAHTLVFGVLLVALAAGVYQATSVRLRTQLDADLANRAAQVRLLFSVGSSQVNWLEDKQAVERAAPLLAHAIYDSQGNYLDGSTLSSILDVSFTDTAREALRTRESLLETVRGAGQRRTRVFNLVLTGSDGHSYVLRVAASLDAVEYELSRLLTSIVTLVPLVLTIGGIAGWWLAGQSLRPVSEITETAGKISALNLAERLPLSGTNDELDRLRSQLNAMIARLQSSFEQMSQFLSNVSHELRTPLAALRGRSEVALRKAGTVEELRQVLAGNIEMHEKLARTVADLLVLARAEAGQTVLNHQIENLADLVRDVVESVRPLAEEMDLTLRVEAPGELKAEIDPTHVMRLLVNLLDNAIKYNLEQGSVHVALQAEDGWAHLAVSDTGRGIPAADLPHVFDRFYRANVEGAGTVGGAGLGLGLSRWVALAHGGRIEAESQLGQGTTFHVWLPLRKTHPLPIAVAQTAVQEITPVDAAEAMREASRKRRTNMLHQLVRISYLLGMFCVGVALVWRGLLALGFPERFIYATDRSVGYPGFINGAILFLLVSCATMSYANASKE